MKTLTTSALALTFLFALVPQAHAAPQSSTSTQPAVETNEERAERLEREREEREEEKEIEHERAMERIEAATEEEDKLGPLGCACLSIVFPPLFPLWVVLMILVDNEPVPGPQPGVGVEPAVPLERLKEERNEVAAAKTRPQAPAQRF